MPSSNIVKTASTLIACILLLSACATAPRFERSVSADADECVVLLHGLNRSYRAMNKMASSLQDAGFSTVNVDYPSQSNSIEELAPVAVNLGLTECRRTGAASVHFVTHSLGGILLRYAHQESAIPDIGRVVMLGPPNQGSEVVDIARRWPVLHFLSGGVGLQLGTDANSIPAKLGPVDFELGVIAGTRSVSPLMSAILPDVDDGKVTVKRTQVQGMSDFLVVAHSHAFMMASDHVIANTAGFLQDGRFPRSRASQGSFGLSTTAVGE